MKKIISVVLSLALAVNMLPLYSYASDDVENITPKIWQTSSSYFEFSNEKVYGNSSNYSMKVLPVPSGTGAQALENYSVGGAPAGTYTLTFNIHGATRGYLNFKIESRNASNASKEQNLDFNWYGSAVALDDGWYKITKTYTIEEGYSIYKLRIENFHSTERGDAVTMYIDDMCLTADGSDVNLLANGDFEKALKNNTIVPYTLPTGWNKGLSGNATQDIMATVYSVVNDDSSDLNNSLKISNIGILNNHQYYLRPTLLTGASAGEYTLSFNVKGKPSGSLGSVVNVFWTGGKLGDKDVKWESTCGAVITGPDAYGWYTYSWTFTASSSLTGMDFMVYESSKEFYVDNFKLVKSGESKNYISNGSFESIPDGSDTAAGTDHPGYGELNLPYGWYQSFSTSSLNPVNAFFSTTADDAFSGAKALVVNNDQFTNNDNKQIYLRNDKTIWGYSGKYTFTMYVKYSGTPYIKVGFEGIEQAFSLENWSTSTAYTVADAGNDWKKVTYTISAGDMITGFYIMNYGAADNLLIDNVSLKEDASGKELLRNGDFEENAYSPDAYYPQNVISSAYNSGSNAYISWKNPTADSLSAVKVYDLTSGEATLLADDFSVASGAYNSIGTALSAAGDYIFKLVFGFNTHDTTEYIVTGNSLRANYNTSSWVTDYRKGTKAYVPVIANIDSTQRSSGMNSLKIVSNIPEVEANYYCEVRLPVTLEPGATYELSADIKTQNVAQNSFSIGIDWGRNIAVSGTTPWTRYKKIIENESLTDTTLKILCDNYAEGIWLDNISLYKLEGGVRTGTNLVTDSGFETTQNKYCAPVTVTSKALDGALELSWIKNGANDAVSTYNIYKLSDGVYQRFASVYKNHSKIKLDGLVNGNEYTYIVKAQNAGGIESDGTMVSGTPVQKEASSPIEQENEGAFVIKNRSFSKYGDDLSLTQPYITELSSGLIAASMYAKNTSKEDKTLIMFLTLYKNDQVVGITDISKTISVTAEGMPGEVLTAALKVPDDSENDYKVGLMVWENTTSLKPLVDVMILE